MISVGFIGQMRRQVQISLDSMTLLLEHDAHDPVAANDCLASCGVVSHLKSRQDQKRAFFSVIVNVQLYPLVVI